MKMRIPLLLLALSATLFCLSACEEEGSVTTATAACNPGTTMTCAVPGVAGCNGTMTCGATGAFGACSVAPVEDCGTGAGNGIDDNCNGLVDEGCTNTSSGEDCPNVNEQDACLTSCQSVGTRKCGANKKWGQCIPPLEECNGKDDNCNGVPDDGLSRQCETACGKGNEVCANGIWSSCTAPQPQEEVCDGKDNDCDGKTDLAANGTALELACQGNCGLGSQQCINAALGPCSANGTAEICDGLDNDCNNVVDDAPGGCTCTTGQTQLCGSDVGECSQGAQECLSGQWSACKTGMHQNKLWTFNEGASESCDLLDNDCDGDTDEGNPDGGTLCGTQPGLGGITAPCSLGSTQCMGGEMVCIGGVDPEPEVCDDIDNDCDGQTDEENSSDNYESNNSCNAGSYEEVTQGAGKKTLSLNLYPQDDFDWFQIKAKELADFCINDDSEGPYQFSVKMTPPAGLDYDLCVWPADSNSCGGLPEGGGSAGNCDDLNIFKIGSEPETYTSEVWEGGCGDNDDKTFYIKVFSYYSSEEDCAPYTLEFEMTEI